MHPVVLLLAMLLVAVPPGSFLSLAAAPVRGAAYSTPNVAAPRPAVAPCIGALGQVTLVYNFTHVTVQSCYYPVSQVPLDSGNICSITWEFPLPAGATQVAVLNSPIGLGPWTYEAAGPGNVSNLGTAVFWTTYATTPTEAASVFFLQLVGPCYEDPYVLGVNESLAALTTRVVALTAEVTSLFAALQGVNLTAETRIAGVQYLVSKALAEENATYAYRIIGGSPIREGNSFTFPLFLELMNGAVANASITGQVCLGLSITYVSASATASIPWTPVNCGTGHLSVKVTPNATELANLTAGSAILTLTSPVTSGTFTNLAGGVLGSTQVNAAASPGNWWSSIFGISTPPPAQNLSSVSDVVADLAWWGDSAAGRATYALTTIIAVLVYLREAHRVGREKILSRKEASK